MYNLTEHLYCRSDCRWGSVINSTFHLGLTVSIHCKIYKASYLAQQGAKYLQIHKTKYQNCIPGGFRQFNNSGEQ